MCTRQQVDWHSLECIEGPRAHGQLKQHNLMWRHSAIA